MKSSKGRRGGIRSLLVEPFEQVKLGLIFLGLNIVFSTLFLGTFAYYLYDIYSAVAVYFKLSEQESLLTAGKFIVPFTVGSALFILFVSATLFVSIRYTHAIYGPLISINRFLDELLAGQKPGLISLRETDQLQDLAAKLNEIARKTAPDANSAGAMIAINRFLDELIAGKKPSPLKLRDGDPMHELVEKLNAIAARI